jgi:hypothetical protein
MGTVVTSNIGCVAKPRKSVQGLANDLQILQELEDEFERLLQQQSTSPF